MNPLFLNEYFLPLIHVAVKDDPALAAAFNKVSGKFESFASYRQTTVNELKLRDLCTPDMELHPQVRRFIEQIPQRQNQNKDRYEKYKDEIGSNMLRAIKAAAARARRPDVELAENEVQEEGRPVTHEHPLLAEIYRLLPGKKTPSGKGFIHVKEPSESGLLFYTACAEALKSCSPSSLKEFLEHHVTEIRRSCQSVSPPEKLVYVLQIFNVTRRGMGIHTSRVARLPLEQWPSPLREEMNSLYDAVRGHIPDHVYEKACQHDVTLKDRLSLYTVRGAEARVERLIRHHPAGEPLSVRDILKTTETGASKSGGGKTLYHNEFLTPFRRVEQEKVTNGKRKGFDSRTFNNTLSSLLVLASYNGIFDYYELVRAAFTPKLDVDRIKERKAEKKAVIDRQVIDKWLADEFFQYETILNTGSFRRDQKKRKHQQADDDMRFVLFYLKLITLKTMGHRQIQLRDCKYGENLIVTPDSITFKFAGRQTKNRKPLQFTAHEKTSGKSHGLLIRAHYLYYRRGFPYVQGRYAPWTTEDRNPQNQAFVYLTNDGRFKCFEREDTRRFSGHFKRACYKYLKHPELMKEAALLAHAHYFRGAAMDTFILDQGGSLDSASRYFGVTEKVMEQCYRDRNAPQDASRDVVLMNAQMKELDALMSPADALQPDDPGKADEPSSEVLRHLVREMEELRKEVKEKDLLLQAAQARAEALELTLLSRLAQPQQQSETSKQIQEILDLLRSSVLRNAS